MSETHETYCCPLCGKTSRCEIKGKDDFYTAYYKVVIGLGLGKEVICCCKREALDGNGTYTRPHFDISQKSLVVW